MDLKVLDKITKKYGKEAAYILGQSDQSDIIPVISTGSFNLDIALGVGGLPRGRMVEIYGPESSGKTTICISTIAQVQQLRGVAAFIDVEHALDYDWLKKCKVDPGSLIISQPDTGEQALDLAKMYIESGEVDIVVVDSVAALVPRAEIEGEIGDSHMALQARLMSQTLRQLASILKSSNSLLIFTNQVRQKIGVSWGDPNTTPGGMALKFYASIRIEANRSTIIKDKEEPISNKVRIDIRKNKVAPPFKKTELTIRYDMGIDWIDELVEYGSELGLIEKGGAGWFTVNGSKVQGKEALRDILSSDSKILQLVEDKVRTHFGLPIWRLDDPGSRSKSKSKG